MFCKSSSRFPALAIATVIATTAVLNNGPDTAGDMEVAHIAYTAGLIDIRYAHLALAVSEDAAVREFAETMIRDHTAVNESALKLLEELGATPLDNDTSRELQAQAKKKRQELSRLEGRAFDRAYVANELAYHEFVNETVEKSFIPSVENQRFKALLQGALRTFKVHEAHARRLAS